MWIGLVDDEPVASTALYLRSIRQPERSDLLHIGYWAHLFVLPEHRKRMLYPQLVFTMRRAMAELGIDAIITAGRRPNVTEGHLKLGFKLVCTWPVLLKPLRPCSLVAKHKNIRFAGIIAPLVDAIWRRGQSVRAGAVGAVEEIEASRAQGDASLLAQMAELLESASSDRYATAWTPEILASRLAGGVDGEPYTIFVLRSDGRLDGVAVCRMATRGHDIRTGVLLELSARDGDQRAMRRLAVACERHLAGLGAEAILWLDGAGQPTSGVLRNLGYRTAPDETYRFVAHTSGRADAILDSTAEAWRFTFLDHDAF